MLRILIYPVMDKRVEAIRIESVECVETFVCSVVFLIFKYNELLPRCYYKIINYE